jgi:hypothetical protein
VVPTQAMQAGDFTGQKPVTDPTTGAQFPNNRIPANRISAPAAFFLRFFPLPNTTQGTFVRSGHSEADFNQFDVRVDHQIRAADSLKANYSFTQPQVFAPGPFPENGASTTDQRHQAAGLTETYIFSPNIVNQFTAGYSRQRSFGTPQGLGTDYIQQSGIGGLSQTASVFPGFPGLNISGFTGINGGAFLPGQFRGNNYNYRDLVTIEKGRHFIQAGAEYTRHGAFSLNASSSRGGFNFTGGYTTNAWADYLPGIPFSGSRSFVTNLFGDYMNHFEPFVQDTWKLTPRRVGAPSLAQ